MIPITVNWFERKRIGLGLKIVNFGILVMGRKGQKIIDHLAKNQP